MELYGSFADRDGKGNWDKVSDVETRLADQPEVDLSDLEMDLSK